MAQVLNYICTEVASIVERQRPRGPRAAPPQPQLYVHLNHLQLVFIDTCVELYRHKFIVPT